MSPAAQSLRDARDSEMQARYRAKADRNAQGLGCMACGYMPPAEEYFSRLQAHHVRPVRNGGTFKDGLALLCRPCHRIADELAGNGSALELSALLARIRAERQSRIGNVDLAAGP